MPKSKTETLKDFLANKVTDRFEEGDVIRWWAKDRFLYAALKTSAGWYTTAREYNPYVAQVVTFDELLEILGRSETDNVAVSTGWDFI